MKFTRIIYPLFFLLIYQINASLAQKKNFDSNDYSKWNSAEQAMITNNGKFVSYFVENNPVGSRTLILQSTENNWKSSFEDVVYGHPLISKEGDYAVFLNKKDSLVIVSLGKNLVKYIPNVGSFSMCRNEQSEWVAYTRKQPTNKELILQNLSTGKKVAYNNITNHIMAEDGQTVILKTEKIVDGRTFQELNWMDLKTGKSTLIWEALKVEEIVLDIRHHQLAFSTENGLFSYKMTIHKLYCLINNQTIHLDSGLKLSRIKQFSHDGARLFIELKEEDKPKPKPGLVEVWNYLDHKIQAQQKNDLEARTYAAVVDLTNGKIIRLEQKFEHLLPNAFEDGSSDDIGIITNQESDGRSGEGNWNISCQARRYLVSLKNGRRIPLRYPPEGLSPSGKYLVYLDPEQHTYVSYEVKTGTHHTISKAFFGNNIETDLGRFGIAGWLENDEGLLFYDNYDLWRMDLSGKKAPVNLTCGYGRKHHLVFSITYGQYYHYPINKNKKIVLTAFNLQSKKHGFYNLELNKTKEPELLSMGDFYYGYQEGVMMDIDGTGGIPPIKAKKAEVYVVSRMSAKESTNYFSTKDFKIFKALSNVHPEREYSWYTTQLHTWTSLDGRTLQGVLYKPENFDPTKKYPVIFNYYEGKSNNLNVYIKPEDLCNGCAINIPTYVNNGYLVFTPDIVYEIGDPMQGTYNSVVSAADYISTLPYVDPTKMGIQGCSWGGIQTNYLVTHTNLFAAACSASGIADWISNYGRLDGDSGNSNQLMYETGQFRMGNSIWKIPDAYIKNSPIFRLDKVTTPLLIMHTKKDIRCSFDDAIELFTGLRRLGKRSWMLAYPDEDHGIFDEKRARDFSVRMMQFFDHYLKDKPAPLWMTTAVQSEKQELENGLAYDTKFKTPGPGLLTTEEQQKVDSIMTRKPILIELK